MAKFWLLEVPTSLIHIIHQLLSYGDTLTTINELHKKDKIWNFDLIRTVVTIRHKIQYQFKNNEVY